MSRRRSFEERFGVSRELLRRRVSEETIRQERRRREAEREQLLRLGAEFQELGYDGFRRRG